MSTRSIVGISHMHGSPAANVDNNTLPSAKRFGNITQLQKAADTASARLEAKYARTNKVKFTPRTL